jgi:ubiquinone/menaquinone biosynthesis C-methylase UbiE
MDLGSTLILSFIAFVLVAIGWWLIVPTEGVYLGRRMVVWLYDLFANRYDAIKHYQPDYEYWLLATPILHAIEPHQSPLVLDVATGTGRLPLALLEHEAFQGRVIAADLSRRMLTRAAIKLAHHRGRVALLWCPAESLPFADNTFDIVTCLEALEFMQHPTQVLRELIRVLRPGGLLLTTNRINTRLMPGKTWTDEQLATRLESYGIEHVTIEVWQVDYHKVWGLKAGDAPPTGARPLGEVLRCPRCSGSPMIEQEGAWLCEGCPGRALIGNDGVIELFPLYSGNQ